MDPSFPASDVLCCGDMGSAVHKRGADRGGAAASTWICQMGAVASGARSDGPQPGQQIVSRSNLASPSACLINYGC